MTALRLATNLAGITALAGLMFGWATSFFAVGMIAAAVWLILFGLLLSLKNAEINRDVDTLRDMPRGPVRSEIVHRHPPGWQHIDGGKRADWRQRGPYGAAWPFENGAPE